MEKENLRPAGEKRKPIFASALSKRRAVSEEVRLPTGIASNTTPLNRNLFNMYNVPIPDESKNKLLDTSVKHDKNDMSIASHSNEMQILNRSSSNLIGATSSSRRKSDIPIITKQENRFALGVRNDDSIDLKTGSDKIKQNLLDQTQDKASDSKIFLTYLSPKEYFDNIDLSDSDEVDENAPNCHFPDCPLGIENIGNSCFINAVLRSLLSLPHFVDQLNYTSISKDDNLDQSTIIQRKTTELLVKNIDQIRKFIEFQCTNTLIIHQAIREIWAITQLDQFKQHDAHEFLLSLFDKLPFCEDVFAVHMQNVVTCVSCSNMVVKNDKSLDLCVAPMDDARKNVTKTNCNISPFANADNFNDLDSRKLSDCLKQFFESEYVDDFKCEQCKRSGVFVAKRISTLSPIVVICLMRFDYKDNSPLSKVMSPIKLSNRIVIPAELNFEHFCLKPSPLCMYKLSAVVSHHGLSPEFGHYMCDAELKSTSFQVPQRCCQQNHGYKWYTFDDSNVRESGLSDVLLNRQKSAYILFYRKIM